MYLITVVTVTGNELVNMWLSSVSVGAGATQSQSLLYPSTQGDRHQLGVYTWGWGEQRNTRCFLNAERP